MEQNRAEGTRKRERRFKRSKVNPWTGNSSTDTDRQMMMRLMRMRMRMRMITTRILMVMKMKDCRKLAVQ
jgi:hypothetical protein